MDFLIYGYALVPAALIVMFGRYRPINWLWFALIIISIFIGIAPFIAAAFLFTAYMAGRNNTAATSTNGVTYHPDGSYTVYKIEDTKNAPSPGRTAFRILGGLIAGVTIGFGLLIVGVILLFTLAPSVACGGSSKCY